MNPHLLNPAGRLYEFLRRTWEAPDNAQLANVWGSYVEADANSEPAAYMTRLGELLLLPAAVREDVSRLTRPPLPKSQLLRAVPQAETVLSFAWSAAGHSVIQIRPHFHQGTLSDLETCSRILNGARGIQEDEDDDASSSPEDEQAEETPLETVRRLAEEILTCVREGDFPEPVARALLEYAGAIVKAADLFHISGPEGVAREYERLLGAAVRDPALRDAIRSTPGIRDRVSELAKFVTLIGAALVVPADVALKAAEAYAALAPLIGS